MSPPARRRRSSLLSTATALALGVTSAAGAAGCRSAGSVPAVETRRQETPVTAADAGFAPEEFPPLQPVAHWDEPSETERSAARLPPTPHERWPARDGSGSVDAF